MTAKIKVILLVLGLFILISCTPKRTLIPEPPNAAGCFNQVDLSYVTYPMCYWVVSNRNCPCVDVLCQRGVRVVLNKPMNMRAHRNMVYIKRNNFSSIPPMVYDDFIMMAFIRQGLFKKIVTAEPTVYINVESPVIENIDCCPWYDEQDPYSLRQLRARYGDNFIIAEATLREYEPNQGFMQKRFSFELKFIDASDGVVIAEFYKEAESWYGTDRSVANPVLNAARNWIVTQPCPTTTLPSYSTYEDKYYEITN